MGTMSNRESHETDEMGRATGVGSTAGSCGVPKQPNQPPSRNETGLDASHDTPHLSEERGEVFFLDILSLQELYQA